LFSALLDRWIYMRINNHPAAREAMKDVREAIQDEIDQLRRVSIRLDSLASQHPDAEQQIMSISGNILSTAIFLDVLLVIRLRPA